MSVKKPTESHRICPHFERQVQSKYFHGIKCNQYYISKNLGQDGKWTEEKRDKKLIQHCFDHYLTCPIFQKQQGHVKRQ